MNEKTLVAYFSCTNTTKEAALKLANKLSADTFAIDPTSPYTNEDLNWNDSNSRTTMEKNNPNFRPEIKDVVSNFNEYQNVFIGFPVWWYKAPNIIYSFLDQYDFTGKKVIAFCTSGGTGIDGCLNYLKKDYPNISFVTGKRISSESDIDSLIKDLV